MPVERNPFITRNMVRGQRSKLFLFGDNLMRRGMGGQARAMRGEPNAIGIATKKSPTMTRAAFFTDDEFEENCRIIDADLAPAFEAINQRWVVIPKDGLGTGLSQMAERCPRTFDYLNRRLKDLEDAG